MNRGFPPLNLNLPEARPRRGETPRFGPLPPEVLKRRHEIAKALNVRVSQLSRRLRNMSSEERRAVFYKLTMSKGVDAKKTLGGTKLKPVSQPAPNVILAVPQEESLDVLLGKVAEFDQADVERGRLPNDWITSIERIEEAKPKDRLSPELREKYSSLKRRRSLFCEIELLSQSVGKNRQLTELEAWLVDLNNAFANGVHGSLFEYEVAPPICRAVVRCTGEMFRKLVEESRWVERIKQIDSRPAFQPFSQTLEEFRFQNLFPIMNPPDDAPVVCVVDSGVTSGNPFLKPVVIPELSKSFLRKNPEDPNDGYGHGSAVASLAAYHALNLAEDATNEPRVRIANARILDENNKIEDERLLSKVLEEVVRHYTSEGVRIFCLALGDDAKIWEEASKRRLPRQSWVARRLDQLSREFDIVFVTCTGNLLCSEISEFLQERRSYPLYLANSNSRILDPGQAALAITVGSVAPGTKLVHGKGSTAIAQRDEPSPFTRSGPGICGELKPEVVEYGGNLAFDRNLRRARSNVGLQVVAASNRLTPAAAFWEGTSFAAPRVAHRLALIDYDLKALGLHASAPLLRAFLVNSSEQLRAGDSPGEFRRHFDPKEHPDQPDMLLGHGIPNQDRATGCDDYSAVLFFQGEILPDHVLFFDIPIPGTLSEFVDRRRLTVTVCHSPEVQKWGLERYLGSDLKWRMFRGDKSREEIIEAMSAPDEPSDDGEGTGEAEEPEDVVLPGEINFKPCLSKRSRGTVQHATHHWSRHKQEFSEGQYVLAIASHKRWTRNIRPVPIAVVVRIEDLGRRVPIYSEIRTAIEVRV